MKHGGNGKQPLRIRHDFNDGVSAYFSQMAFDFQWNRFVWQFGRNRFNPPARSTNIQIFPDQGTIIAIAIANHIENNRFVQGGTRQNSPTIVWLFPFRFIIGMDAWEIWMKDQINLSSTFWKRISVVIVAINLLSAVLLKSLGKGTNEISLSPAVEMLAMQAEVIVGAWLLSRP